MTKYLITGGAGFIGSNIAKKILENGDFVRAVDNFATGRKENIAEFLSNPNFEFIEEDLINIEAAQKVVKGMDVVLHQAAVNSVPRSIDNPSNTNNSNINGTLNMLLAARDEKVKKFVYASSSSVYGDNPELPKHEEMPIKPISPYALTKYTGERYCQIFWNLYGVPTVCLRYFNVFGPKQNPHSEYSAVIPKFIGILMEGKTPVILGNGEQGRDFTFVENVVSANLLAAKAPEIAHGQVFNIACGKEHSLNEMVKLLNENLGKNIVPEHQSARQGDIMHTRADISKAKEVLGYEPTIDFAEGLKRAVAWYKSSI